MRSLGTVLFGFLFLLLIVAGGYFFLGGTDQWVIETELGAIVIEFFPREAPEHVKNFKKLAREDFFNGTTFHRAAVGYIIQGGDPLSKDDNPYNDGLGGPEWTVRAEFNDISHERGIVSAAREDRNVDSAGSQFFICLSNLPRLDRQYTVFGRVVEGMDVVDRIARRPKSAEDPERPINPVPISLSSIRTLYRLPLVGEFSF